MATTRKAHQIITYFSLSNYLFNFIMKTHLTLKEEKEKVDQQTRVRVRFDDSGGLKGKRM